MSKDGAAQKWPSFSGIKDVSAAPTESAHPKQTLDPRPSFSNASTTPPAAPHSVDIDDAGNVKPRN